MRLYILRHADKEQGDFSGREGGSRNQPISADFRFPEGETGTEAQRRIAGFIEEKKNQGEDILVVSHDGLIRCLLCYIVGIPVYRRYMFQVDTCGLMEIEHRDPRNGWKLIRFNQKHVGGVGA